MIYPTVRSNIMLSPESALIASSRKTTTSVELLRHYAALENVALLDLYGHAYERRELDRAGPPSARRAAPSKSSARGASDPVACSGSQSWAP